jgi:hypothetical protein
MLASAVLMCSCGKDFLDSKPKGKLSDGVLGTPENIESLCISAYAALTVPYNYGQQYRYAYENNWVFGEVRAETAYKGGGGTNDIWEINALETYTGFFPSNDIANGTWSALYISIQRCNDAIRLLTALSENDFPERNSRIGEMRFLRAHYYFNLSRLFNRIVWFDETADTNDLARVPNDVYSRDQILEMIAAEFSAAAELLPERQTEVGRVTKYAAIAYQAKTILYRAYGQDKRNQFVSLNRDLLEDVVNLCDEVINSGRYDLLDEFTNLALVEYETGSESVFAVKHSTEDGSPNGHFNWCNTLNIPRAVYSGDGFYQPSQHLVNSFKTSPEGLPLFDTYNDSNLATVDDGFRFNVDPRLDYTVGRIGIRWKTYTGEAYNESWVRDPATYGYFSSKKFLLSPEDPNMRPGWPWGASCLDYQVVRYADVLLWKAEALIQLDRQNEALPLINEIRTRTKNSQYVRSWSGDSYAANYRIETYKDGVNCSWTKDYAWKALMFERKLELALEGERFFDLVRWGVADQVLNVDYLPKERLLREYLKAGSFVPARDEYLPIPQIQIGYSFGAYKQNPGYEGYVEE